MRLRLEKQLLFLSLLCILSKVRETGCRVALASLGEAPGSPKRRLRLRCWLEP